MTGLQPTKLIRLRHSLVPLDPETMGRFFIINAPYLFSGVWSLIKPWLDEVTVKKISIPGRDWKAQLLAQIPAENLEVRFGGTSTDPSTSDAGPWNTEAGKKGAFPSPLLQSGSLTPGSPSTFCCALAIEAVNAKFQQ